MLLTETLAARGSQAVFIGILLGSCAPAATPRWQVEVQGSREVMERFAVSADGLRDEGLFYEGDHFVRVLAVEGPDVLEGSAAAIRSAAGELRGETLLQPFACRADAATFMDLRQRGWSFLERHQLRLTESGAFQRNTDLSRILSYKCEARSNDKREGQAWSSRNSTAGLCEESERLQTQVTLSRGAQLIRADLCHGAYLRVAGGVVMLQFAFPLGDDVPLTITMAHCIDPQTATYPISLSVGAGYPRADCPYVSSAAARVGDSIRALPVVRGTWRIDSIDFAESGHLVGDVSFVYPAPDGTGELIVRGHVDLPLLRLGPSQGGN